MRHSDSSPDAAANFYCARGRMIMRGAATSFDVGLTPAAHSKFWGGSSTGRALALHAGGCEFDSHPFHQFIKAR